MNKKIYVTIEQLSRNLRVKYKLPPERPTIDEIILIVNDLSRIPERQRNEKIWAEVVHKHVNFEGEYLYKGLDFSDINLLLNQLLSILGDEKLL